MFEHTHLNVISFVPELITSFTQQSDREKVNDCAIMKLLIDQAVNMAISVATSIVGSAISSVGETGMAMGWTTARFGTPLADKADVVKQAEEKWLASAGKAADWKEYSTVYENARPYNLDWFSIIYGAGNSWGTYRSLVQTKTHWDDLPIEGGMSYGSLCSQFEGDFSDNNSGNKDKLLGYLPQIFDQIRNRTEKTFHEIYIGVIPEQGQPSLMAVIMANSVWAGEGSMLDNMGYLTNLQL
jgi:hypothetical protein